MLAQFSVIALDILLLATLVYLFVLMRKLKVLSSHRDDMRTIISDVIVATESSRDAVARLKSSVIESQNSMVKYFEDARQIQSEFDKRIADANRILAEIDMVQSKIKEIDLTSLSRIENKPSRLSHVAQVEKSETYRHAAPDPSGMDRGKPFARHSSEGENGDLQRRLATIHESVNHLRSKILAHS